MRRKDREVTRHGDLMEMVARFKVCRLGLWDGREVYVVPLNFGYEEKNGSLSLFFHCAREGRKLDILQNRPEVSFEMDGDHVLLEGDAPCRYSYAYGCVMGRNDTKAIAMSVLDHALTLSIDSPTSDMEFVLLHGDCLEMNGFISHLKLPHYVTFQSKLDSLRMRKRSLEHDAKQ